METTIKGAGAPLVAQLDEVDLALAQWAQDQIRAGASPEDVKDRLRGALSVCEAESAEKRRLFMDVLTDWVEGGLYWATPTERPSRDDDLNVLSVKVQDREDDSEPIHSVTLDTVRLGFVRLLAGKVAINGTMLGRIAEAYATNDGGIMDAYDDDAVIQAGLFNELVYG